MAILVIRKIKIGNSNVLRIIDFIGKQNEFSNIGNLITYLFKKYKSEFIDIYSYGINVKYIKKVGFVDRRKINNLVVPDYYEPFIEFYIEECRESDKGYFFGSQKYMIDLWWDHNKDLYETKTPYI